MVKRVCYLPTRVSASAPSIFVKESLGFFGKLSIQNLFNRFIDQIHIRRAIPANNIRELRCVCAVAFGSERSSAVRIRIRVFLKPIRKIENNVLFAAWDCQVKKPSQFLRYVFRGNGARISHCRNKIGIYCLIRGMPLVSEKIILRIAQTLFERFLTLARDICIFSRKCFLSRSFFVFICHSASSFTTFCPKAL